MLDVTINNDENVRNNGNEQGIRTYSWTLLPESFYSQSANKIADFVGQNAKKMLDSMQK